MPSIRGKRYWSSACSMKHTRNLQLRLGRGRLDLLDLETRSREPPFQVSGESWFAFAVLMSRI